jgi:hypothetical protein
MTLTMPVSNHLYYFAVRTEDENGNLSDLSNIASAISGAEDYTFSLVSPAFNDTIDTFTPTLEWEEFSGDTAATYTLWYGQDNLFETKTQISGLVENEYQLTDSLSGNIAYYWKVFAITTSSDTVWCNQSYFRLVVELVTPTTGNKLSNENVYIYPNPFNPDAETGTIRYSLSENGNITIKIYDITSKLVRTLIENVSRTSMTEFAEPWDGKNDSGDIVANGVYFYVIVSSSGERAVGKAAVLR